MTIKTESDHHGQPYVPGTGQSVVQGTTTRAPDGTAENTASANEHDIPFATAVLVGDVPPSYNPSYVGPAAMASTNPGASAAEVIASDNNHYPNHQTQSTTTQPAYPSSSPPSATEPTVIGTSHAIHAGGRPSPPGVPPGGRWVKMRHIGNSTWITFGIVSAVTCLFMCFPCGVWAFLCPCDERDAYLVNAKLFDEHGDMIGSAKTRNYRG